uniref:UTP--glucose-1-phosphate uridylyltransferase n=1 Tax=Oryza glumipatula TaxID=40148 RepID=A0A0E0B699_9ORYZ
MRHLSSVTPDTKRFTNLYRAWRRSNHEEDPTNISGCSDELKLYYHSLLPPDDEYAEVKRLLTKVAVVRTLPGGTGSAGIDAHLPFVIKQIKALNEYYDCNIPICLVIPWNKSSYARALVESNAPLRAYLDQAKLPVISQSTNLPFNSEYYIGQPWFYSLGNSSLLLSPEGRNHVSDLAKKEKDFLVEVYEGTDYEKSDVLVARNGRLNLIDRESEVLFQGCQYNLTSTKNMWVKIRRLDKQLKQGNIDLKLIPKLKVLGGARTPHLFPGMVVLDYEDIGCAIKVFKKSAAVVVTQSRKIRVSAETFDWHLSMLAKMTSPSKGICLSTLKGLLIFFSLYHLVLGVSDTLIAWKIEDPVRKEWAKLGCWYGALLGYLGILFLRRWHEKRGDASKRKRLRPQNPEHRMNSDGIHLAVAGVVRFLCSGLVNMCEEYHLFVMYIAAVHAVAFLLETVGCLFIEVYVGKGFREPVESF